MKEMLDWLREQIETHLEQCIELRESSSDRSTEVGYGHRIDVYNRTLRYINEAEAKWAEDCCEWIFMEGVEDCRCGCNGYHVDYMVAEKYNYCPYCGKRIKISEVE